MNQIYIITQLCEYHLMYEISDEHPIQLTLGDVQHYVDELNSQERPIEYGDFENKKSLPKYSYKEIKTSQKFTLIQHQHEYELQAI